MRWLVVVSLVLLFPAAPSRAEGFAAECAPPDAIQVTVGVVDCQRMHSEALGAVTAFAYYVPPACDPALGRGCPVLYFLHGTGGRYSIPAGLVEALTSGPPVDPRSTDEPWTYESPSTWVPKASIDMILVGPHGLTLPGGYGPGEPGQNAFWMDWNPRYAKGGDSQRYDTPPPRFETHLVEELVPFVDRHFPTVPDRTGRAITGKSMGGIGAFPNALKHPDVWSSMGMLSGGGFPFNTAEDVDSPVSVSPPAPVPYTRLPGAVPSLAPEAVWSVLYGTVATVGYGDHVADNVWWQANQAASLASNARARADGVQSLHVKYHVNDAVPRRVEDLTDPVQIFFEVILYPTNLQLETVFDRYGVERDFDVGPGVHSNTYQRPYYRDILEQVHANLRHWDGGGSPRPAPEIFDYRSIRERFRIWGWNFQVDREPVEFLNLTDVSCNGLTLRGSGTVRVTVRGSCATGLDGRPVFDVDLGPQQATDEPPAAGGTTAYGRTVRVELEPLDGR